MMPVSQLRFWLSILVAIWLALVALPAPLASARPLWLPMVLCFWTLYDPRVPTLIAAFLSGLLMDAAFGNLLGQNGLGLLLVVLAALRLRVIFGLLPVWQATLVLAPVWLLYAVLMFWVDGVTGHGFDPWKRWLPLASTVLLWPLIAAILHRLRRRRRDDD